MVDEGHERASLIIDEVKAHSEGHGTLCLALNDPVRHKHRGILDRPKRVQPSTVVHRAAAGRRVVGTNLLLACWHGRMFTQEGEEGPTKQMGTLAFSVALCLIKCRR